MYSRPRRRAASTISSSVAWPSVAVGVHVQVAADVVERHQLAAARRPRPSRTRRAPRASPAETAAGRARRRLPPRCGRRSYVARRPPSPASLTRNTPHSLIFSPRSFAMPRRTTLCSFDPVKYCSAAPNDSRGHDAQVDLQPVSSRTDIFVSPRADSSATPRELAETVHHRRHVGRRRRAGRDRRSSRGRGGSCRPSRSAARRARCACARAAAATITSASAHRIRTPASSATARPLRIASSVLAPKPLSTRTRCCSHAARSSASDVDAQLRVKRRRLLRPHARHARQRQHARGNRPAAAPRASAACRSSSSVRIFSARSLPMPSMSVSDATASSAIAASGSVRSPILRAPLR